MERWKDIGRPTTLICEKTKLLFVSLEAADQSALVGVFARLVELAL